MGPRIRAISNIKPPLPGFAGEAVFCFNSDVVFKTILSNFYVYYPLNANSSRNCKTRQSLWPGFS